MANPPHPTPLGRVLADEIRRGGPMPFAEFMGRCLYDPAHGYYAQPGRGLGRAGDFYTSVSVGPVLGDLLADHAAAVWEKLGRPASFHLVEQGAHDGKLMADVLEGLTRNHRELAHLAAAVIIEPLSVLRAAQRDRLSSTPVPVRWFPTLAELAPAPLTGMVFCNELLDSFPVERVRFDGAHWHRLGVGVREGGDFSWVALAGPLPSELEVLVGRIGSGSPPGYTTELCPALDPWVRDVAAALELGRVVVLDYAREADDYFASHRTDGTLRGYCRHQRCDDPFAAPGETDLTADLNATHLRDAAVRAGLAAGPLVSQETFLTRIAASRLRAMEPGALVTSPAFFNPTERRWLRQFQTLAHPALLGRAFSVLELVK